VLNFDFIKDKFKGKHEKIDNCYYLNKYINFLIEYGSITEDNVYIEKHHILPISVFPEYKKSSWNIINLKYEDHILVHLWLFKSINIRKYQRPLNWMNREYKNSKEISNAAKRGWETLKKDKEKYLNFCKKRSNHMKTLSSDEQRRRAKIFWDNITDENYKSFCDKMKSYWSDAKKKEKSNSMKDFYSNPENRKKKRVESLNHWKSIDKNNRKKFKEKMAIINKDENKRKLAGDKIKELWKSDEEFLKKMKNRRHKSGIKMKLIKQNGEEIIYMSMKELINKQAISPYLIRKYKDTGKKIIKESLNKYNMFLIGCLIETINYKK